MTIFQLFEADGSQCEFGKSLHPLRLCFLTCKKDIINSQMVGSVQEINGVKGITSCSLQSTGMRFKFLKTKG